MIRRATNFFLITITLVGLLPGSRLLVSAQENEFMEVVKGLLQGEEFQKIQNVYSSLPLELRNKLTKDLLSDPAKVGKDILSLVGPQFQSLLAGFAAGSAGGGAGGSPRGVGDNVINTGSQGQGGIEFGPLASMLGNLVGNNPQMLLSLAQNYLQNQDGSGFNFESITKMVTENFDINSAIEMASSLGLFPSGGGGGGARGDQDGAAPGKTISEMLKLNEIVKMWQDFAKSPLGQKVNRVAPRLLKSASLPDALRLLEKETSFKFDVILKQIQEPHIRQALVSQTVKPIARFFKGITIPTDLKVVLARSDQMLKKMGLDVKAKDFIEPAFNYIRDTFKITRESFLDFKVEDIEKIATDVINNEVLDPLAKVYSVYQKALQHPQCSQFIYCQFNHNFYAENFIRRNVVKSASIISAFQFTSLHRNIDFSKLYEAAYKGANGYDCTMGVSSFCLDVMSTAAHNEL